MGKLDKEQEARMAGMSYGVRIAREKGIDEAEKELKLRGALGVGLLIDNTRKHMIINPCAWYLWISTQNIL